MKTIEKKLWDSSGTKEMLDLKPGASVKQVYQYLDSLGPQGRTTLKEMYYFYDLIYPIIYGLFFSSILVFSIAKLYPKNKRVFWFTAPVIVMVLFDYSENFTICYLINNLQSISPLSFYLGAFTTIKWLSGLITVFLILYLGCVFVYRKFRKSAT